MRFGATVRHLFILFVATGVLGCAAGESEEPSETADAEQPQSETPSTESADEPSGALSGEPSSASTAASSATSTGPRAASSLTFTKRVATAELVGANSAVAGDLDGDGEIDLIASGTRAVVWWRNDGTGSFTESVLHGSIGGSERIGVNDLAIADIDGDGDPDLVGIADEALHIWENAGNETFKHHHTPITFGGAGALQIGDLDSDGDIDLIAASAWDDRFAWWENDGAGAFEQRELGPRLEGASAIVAGDFDSDGDVDLIGISGEAEELVLWRNDGAAVFSADTIDEIEKGSYSLAAGDLDGDGDIDLVAPNSWAGEGSLLWWRNDGDASFTRYSLDRDIDPTGSVAVADIDGDGMVDIVGRSGREVAWWHNNGSAAFTRRTVGTEMAVPSSIVATEFTGDGLLEVVATSYDDAEVAWWEQLPEAEAAATELPDWQRGLPTEVVAITSSSHLIDSGDEERYAPARLLDGDPRTSWVEGREDSGTGETVSIELSPPVVADTIRIMPGYFDSRYWSANNRVAAARITVQDDTGTQHVYEAPVVDAMQTQSVRIGSRSIWKIDLEITDVYSGDRWDDTCIAELSLERSGNRVPMRTAPRVDGAPPAGAVVAGGSQIDSWSWRFYRDGTFVHRSYVATERERELSEHGTWSFVGGELQLTIHHRQGTYGVGEFREPSGEPGGPGPMLGSYEAYQEFSDWGTWSASEPWATFSERNGDFRWR